MTADDTPTLAMLWESKDPDENLQSRFGFDNTDAVIRWLSSALDEHWGVQVASCERVLMSDTNALAWLGTSSGRMVAKWSVASERFARLAALARLTAWLEQERVPVSAPIPTAGGDLQSEFMGASLCLQREIQGDLLDAGHPGQVRASGAVLARLHDALASYPEADRFPVPAAGAEPLQAQITQWLDSAPGHKPQVACDILRRLVAGAPAEALPVQLVHGDYRSANVLCASSEVAAVIDFEEARFDHRIVELGRSAALLGTQFRGWGPVSSGVRARFLDGYQSVRLLTPAEAAWWPITVLWPLLVMVPQGDDQTGWGAAALAYARELE